MNRTSSMYDLLRDFVIKPLLYAVMVPPAVWLIANLLIPGAPHLNLVDGLIYGALVLAVALIHGLYHHVQMHRIEKQIKHRMEKWGASSTEGVHSDD